MRFFTSSLAAAAILAGLTIAGPASAATDGLPARTCTGEQIQPVTVGKASGLNGVAATSSCNAWAAGASWDGTTYQSLIERWNGAAWHVQPSPDPGGTTNSNVLAAVAAHSQTDAWAVGNYNVVEGDLGFGRSFIVHWNGTAWQNVGSPQPGYGNTLSAITAGPSGRAWAVGYYLAGKFGPWRTLVEHWDGTSWIRIPSPNAGGAAASDELESVTATSPENAWAVGNYSTATGVRTLTEHWNGKNWRLVPSPNLKGVNISGPNYLTSVTATSGSSAWAVGMYMRASPDSFQSLILHWNGKTWARSATPLISSDSRLDSVTSIPDGQAWAVGYCDGGPGTMRQWLIGHFSANAWHFRISLPRSSNYDLTSVGATSPSDVWALGGIWNSAGSAMLALHF